VFIVFDNLPGCGREHPRASSRVEGEAARLRHPIARHRNLGQLAIDLESVSGRVFATSRTRIDHLLQAAALSVLLRFSRISFFFLTFTRGSLTLIVKDGEDNANPC